MKQQFQEAPWVEPAGAHLQTLPLEEPMGLFMTSQQRWDSLFLQGLNSQAATGTGVVREAIGNPVMPDWGL